MDKVHIFTQYNIKEDRTSLVSARNIIGIIIVFLLGRVVAFGVMAPFALAFLAAYITESKAVSWRFIAVAAIGLLGTAASGTDIPIIKYMLAYVLFGLIYVSVTTLTDSRKNYAISGMAGIALLLAGIIFSAQTGFVLYDILMLALECVFCVVSAQLMQGAQKLFQSPLRKSSGLYVNNLAGASPAEPGTAASIEELAGLYLIAVLCIFGLSNIVIWKIALGNSIAASLIMLLALTGGISAGAAGGVGAGIIYGITKFPLTETVGVYSFCGLAAGLMRKFNKAGVALGFFMGNSILSLYLGGFDSGVFNILELVLAIVIFCCVPKSVVIEAESILSRTTGTGNVQKSIKFISQKLNAVASSFSSLSGTFSEMLQPEKVDNYIDITTLFDKAADKVCRRCGLKFMCWEKQFNATYDSMMKLAPVFKNKGKASTSDLPQPFRSKCIKTEEYIAELNRLYGQHKLDMKWQQKVIESQEFAAQQLTGISKIMDNLISEIDNTIEFDSILDKRIIVALEHAGLKRCEATVIKNKYGRYEVSVKLKKCAEGLKCTDTVIPVVSDILGKEMDKRDSVCASEKGGSKCEMYLVEKEKYSVVCGAARRIKDGQSESGDNFNYLRICDGKYVLVLSDGMGSGKQAASQSNTTVTLLEQLLSAGFDKTSAIKIINSALLIKTHNECFATIDITILDLFSGEAEFIKIGANSTFIKHKKRVEQIKSSTLPAGILSDVDVETSSKKLSNGDYIIMLSDGVHSAADNWITNFLSKLDNLPPQAVAEEIMKEASRRKNGIADDDMTVIAAKLLES